MNTISTYTGRTLDFSDPKPEMIDPIDIAHGLSMMCRFNGHISDFYSVAQHSVLGSYELPLEWAPIFLLHDAPEAYMADIVRPAKRLIVGYAEVEDRLFTAIGERFDIDPALFKHPTIVEADNRMLITERNQLQRNWTVNREHWASLEHYQPFDIEIDPWRPSRAEENFRSAFQLYFQKYEAAHVPA